MSWSSALLVAKGASNKIKTRLSYMFARFSFSWGPRVSSLSLGAWHSYTFTHHSTQRRTAGTSITLEDQIRKHALETIVLLYLAVRCMFKPPDLFVQSRNLWYIWVSPVDGDKHNILYKLKLAAIDTFSPFKPFNPS